MTNIEAVVQQIAAADGGVVSRQLLLACDVSPGQIAEAVDRRYLRVIRRGWYDAGSTDAAVLAAVRAGGVLGCVSALGRAGRVWNTPDAGIHVRRSLHYRRGLPDTGCRGYRTLPKAVRAVDPVPVALACAARCAEPEHLVAICDSLLRHRPGWTVGDLRSALAGAPEHVRRLLQEIDGAADSGIESLVRFRLRRSRIRVRTQVEIRGVGRVDLVVGDRLIIECDGREHHLGDQFGRDRWRDLVAVAGGFVVLRLSYRHVLYQWDEVYPYICEVVRSRRHLDRVANHH